jgi:hypothetical protein
MTKTELAYQILLVVAGGAIGTVSALVSGIFTRRAEYAREDLMFLRTRREDLAGHLFVLDAWIVRQRDTIIDTGNADDTDNPLFKIRALTHLYFPTMCEDCETLEKCVINIQTAALKIHSEKLQGKVNGDLFDSIMPKTGALQTLADNLLKELKTAPTSACTLRATARK